VETCFSPIEDTSPVFSGLGVKSLNSTGDFPHGAVAKTLSSQGRGPGSIPGQETRSHMLQLRVHMPYLRPSATEEMNTYLNKRAVLVFCFCFFFLSLNSTDDLCILQSWGAPSGGPPLPKEQGLTGSGQEGSNVRRQVKKEGCECNRAQEHGLGSPIDLGSKLASDLGQLTTAAAAKLLQSCPTLRDPTDCSLPGSSAHGIFQARVLEWGAIAFSN